jgi:hypothetical protein
VIGGSRYKSSQVKPLEQLHPEKTDKDEPTSAKSAMPAQWPTKPRIVQFNAGRIEMSMPYPLAIALLMGIVLLVLVVFRLGQSAGLTKQIVTDPAVEISKSREKTTGQATSGITQVPEVVEKITPVPVSAEKVEPIKPKGNNRIVIQTHQLRADLEPVKDYFAGFGIETEIRQIGGVYYLITKNKYENPERVGTNGYHAKQKIIELGANYKAPQGYGTFGKKPFHDAYGMKFDD